MEIPNLLTVVPYSLHPMLLVASLLIIALKIAQWNEVPIDAVVKLAIHLSVLAFRHVRTLFCELFSEIANESLYTSHNITDFVHL